MAGELSAGIVLALSAAQPAVYRRHRCTGCDAATDDLAIMEACHGLVSASYRRFVAHIHRAVGRSSAALGETHAALDATPLLVALDKAADPERSGSRGDSDEAPTTASFAASNAQHRRVATTWLDTQPFGKLVLQRSLMEPRAASARVAVRVGRV